jgi:hypothetical protein
MQSCTSCQKPREQETKHIHPQPSCPFRMSDGRNFTDYRTRCTIDYQRKKANAYKSSYDERQYLISNASQMMNENLKHAEQFNQCSGCYKHNETGTMLPEQNMTSCNDKTCSFYTNTSTGLGTGRNYNSV